MSDDKTTLEELLTEIRLLRSDINEFRKCIEEKEDASMKAKSNQPKTRRLKTSWLIIIMYLIGIGLAILILIQKRQ